MSRTSILKSLDDEITAVRASVASFDAGASAARISLEQLLEARQLVAGDRTPRSSGQKSTSRKSANLESVVRIGLELLNDNPSGIASEDFADLVATRLKSQNMDAKGLALRLKEFTTNPKVKLDGDVLRLSESSASPAAEQKMLGANQL